MSTSNAEHLADLLSRAGENGSAPRGWEGALAERVRDLLRTHQVDLAQGASLLLETFQAQMARLAPEVRDALMAAEPREAARPMKQCYRLGQLGFANLVLAQAASTKADARFETTLTSITHRSCIQQMYEGEKSTSNLADLTGKSTEQTSRNLGLLRQAGISDFRRVSTQTFNFLTPAARHAFKTILDKERQELSEELSPSYSQDACEALARVAGSISPAFRSAPSFVLDGAIVLV